MQKDLFETPELLPGHIQAILSRYNDLELENGIQYQDLIQMGKELAIYGYSFDFYLDCVPFNLKKIPPRTTYIFNVYDYENQKIEFKTKAKYRHIAYEKAHKRFPNSLLIELNKTINN